MTINDRRVRNIIQFTFDVIAVVAIWQATSWLPALLRVGAHSGAGNASRLFGPPFVPALIIWLAATFRLRLYRLPAKINFLTLNVSAAENALILSMIVGVVMFFAQEFGQNVSGSFVPAFLVVALSLFTVLRFTSYGVGCFLLKRMKQPVRIALVGTVKKGNELAHQMQASGFDFLRGIIVPEQDLELADQSSITILGTTHQLAELINSERLDRIVVLNNALPDFDLEQCSRVFKRMNMPVSCALEFGSDQTHFDISTSFGMPFVEVIPTKLIQGQEWIKRSLDIAVSTVALLVLSPLFLLIAFLIKTTSKGPVLYKASRIGKGGRYFTFLKFRSMYTNNDRRAVAATNEKNGHIFKMKNDPRVTWIGRLLRRYSLDELPQFINILRGEMSFVGPRPLPACDLGPDGMSPTFKAWSEGRASVLPGLTGLWQISGRSDLAFDEMVRLDLSYVQNWSLALDLKIMLDTPMLVLRGQGAY